MNTETLPLWRTLRGLIEAAFSLFGAPQEIARKICLTRAEHKHAAFFLRLLEDLLRRLLLLDALERAPQAPLETKRRASHAMPVSTGAAFDPEHPETWRARFHLAAAPDRRLPAGAAPLSLSKRSGAAFGQPKPHRAHLVASAPLALRLEALIRAFNHPAPLAQRLANLLARAPRAAARFAKEPTPRAATFAPALAEAAERVRAALAARLAYNSS